MLYHVSRNGQTYGPYTPEDLQRYVASGNILLTDLARSESMSEWLPVSQVLSGNPGTSFQQPAGPGYVPQVVPSAYPDPPNLHWGIVVLLACFTCSVFMWVWSIVLASWMKKVQPHSKAVVYYIVAAGLFLIQAFVSPHPGMHFHPGGYPGWQDYGFHPWNGLIGIAGWVVKLIARFTLRSELEEHYNTVEPIGLQLSGVMTFFFGGVYFQYHLNRINEMKRMARYGVPPLA